MQEYKKDYYESNKSKIQGKTKEYQEENKEKIQEYHKEYYESNKSKINANVTCECGCLVTKQHLKRHQSTNKHLNKMNASIQ